MSRISKDAPELDYILLCLIRIHPDISGYDLRRIINKSTGFFFQAHLSQIYPALKRLSSKGFVTHSVVARNSRPDLKLYCVTKEGKQAARAWLTKPYEFAYSSANAQHYFLKLVLMGYLEPEEIISYIDQGIVAFGKQRMILEDYNLRNEREFVKDTEPFAKQRFITVWEHEYEFMVRELDERIEWLKQLRDKLEE